MESEGGTGMKQALVGVSIALVAMLVVMACLVTGSIDQNDRLSRLNAELSRTKLQWSESKSALKSEKEASAELRSQLLSVQKQLQQKELDQLALAEELLETQQENETAVYETSTQATLAQESARKLEETEARLTALASEQEQQLSALKAELDSAHAETLSAQGVRDQAVAALEASEQSVAALQEQVTTLSRLQTESESKAALNAQNEEAAQAELKALQKQLNDQQRAVALIRQYKQKGDPKAKQAAEQALSEYAKAYPQAKTDFLWEYLK